MPDGERQLKGWTDHRDEQRRAWLRLTPIQRLRWLDGAKAFVALAVETRRRRAGQ